MAISFSDLFSTLGKIAKIARQHREFQNNVSSQFALAKTAITSSGYDLALEFYESVYNSTLDGTGSGLTPVQALASAVILNAVYNDNPVNANNIAFACQEVIRQMVVAGQSVAKPAISWSYVAPSTNLGDGVLLADLKNKDGSSKSLLFPENDSLLVYDGEPAKTLQSSGRENFKYLSKPYSLSGARHPFVYGYPNGPSVNGGITSVTPFNSMIGDGTFSQPPSSGQPVGWTVVAGVAGTNYTHETAITYNKTRCLKILPSPTFNISKVINIDNTEARNVFVAKVRRDASLTSGAIRFSIKDGSGSVVTGADGLPCSHIVDLSTVSASSFGWTHSFWSSPIIMPETTKVHIEVTTPLVGGSAYLDWFGVYPSTTLYPGGANMCICAGVERFGKLDKFYFDFNNDFCGTTELSTWQWAWDRLLNYIPRTVGLYLPESSSPTILDSLLV